jgi:hypothetical protein
LRDRGGRLPARHMRTSVGGGHRFLPGSKSGIVSQLLAGTLSGPGGSPGAARVLDTASASSPRDAAPHPASRRLMMRPSTDEVMRSVMEVWRPGIRLELFRPRLPRRRDPRPEMLTICSSRPHGRGMRAVQCGRGGDKVRPQVPTADLDRRVSMLRIRTA